MDTKILDDAALLGLIREAIRDSVERGLGKLVADIFYRDLIYRPSVLDAAKQAQAEAKAAKEEDDGKQRAEQAEGLRRHWARLKYYAQMVQAVLGEGYHLSVWERDGGDRRVYIQHGREVRRGTKIVYYVTGNHQRAPGTLVVEQESYGEEVRDDARPHLIRIMRAAAKRWTSLSSSDLDAAARAEVEPSATLIDALKQYGADRDGRAIVDDFLRLGKRREEAINYQAEIAGDRSIYAADHLASTLRGIVKLEDSIAKARSEYLVRWGTEYPLPDASAPQEAEQNDH